MNQGTLTPIPTTSIRWLLIKGKVEKAGTGWGMWWKERTPGKPLVAELTSSARLLCGSQEESGELGKDFWHSRDMGILDTYCQAAAVRGGSK